MSFFDKNYYKLLNNFREMFTKFMINLCEFDTLEVNFVPIFLKFKKVLKF